MALSKQLAYGAIVLAIALILIFGRGDRVSATTPAESIAQGKIAYDRGDFATAIGAWERAEAGYQQARDPIGVAGSQLNRARALVAMGFDRRACKLLTETVGTNADVCTSALPKPSQRNLPPNLQVLAGNALGDVLRLLGNFEAAQAILVQTARIRSLTDGDRAPILATMANIWRDLGERERDRTGIIGTANAVVNSSIESTGGDAATNYQRAISCYRQAGTFAAEIDLYSLQGELVRYLSERGENPATIDLWQSQFDRGFDPRLADRLLASPDDYTTNTQRINLARSAILASQPQWEIAIKLLNRAIDRHTGQNPLFVEATGTLGWLYERKGEWESALKFTRSAISTAAAADRDRLYQWEWQLGRILQHQPQPDRARASAAYDRAIVALENTRREIRIANTDAQFSLRDRVDTLYREAIDLDLRVQQPDLARIVTRMDALKLAELENFLQCQLGNYQPIGKFATDANAIVFYPIVLVDRLEVILGLGNQRFARFSVPVTRRQLEATIDRFRTNLNQPQYGWQDEAAAQLYEWTIRPAQKYLPPTAKQLVFVMDGALQNIPVAAFYDRSSQQYAIDRYAIAVTPGLQMLGAKTPRSDRATILIGGLTANTRSVTRSGVTYEPLTNVAAEVRTIKTLFNRSTQLVGKDFTQTEIQRHLAHNSVAILHLSTHGRFSSDPRETFIAMADGTSLDLDRLRTTLDRQLDLMVLSACETATGDRRAALGLAGVAIRSGAASTLASLWSVDDRATTILMQQFYRSISQSGITKAEALRTAQIAIHQQYPHPYYWAAFVLVGNWL